MEENCRKQSVMFKKEPLVSTSRSHEDLIQNCRSPHKKAARCRIVTAGDDATASNAPLQKRPLSTPLLSRKFSSSPRNCVTLEDQLREKEVINDTDGEPSPYPGGQSRQLSYRKCTTTQRVKIMQGFAANQCFTRAQHFDSPTESCAKGCSKLRSRDLAR
mmetsp:Transcript_42086/g.70210  ORF Transcript_42086/g.70210 Transcript_42086/m.70210 type:complete len:160 (-) Transcript_42086:178-657(-)